MNHVICYAILDDLLDGPENFGTTYIGTLEEPINVYDTDSKIGCYVVVSAIDAANEHVLVSRVLVSQFIRGTGEDPSGTAKGIQFDAANLVATFATECKPDAKIVRGMVAIPRGLVWPVATTNFMSRSETGKWTRLHTFD